MNNMFHETLQQDFLNFLQILYIHPLILIANQILFRAT